jgi:hypothetical protein
MFEVLSESYRLDSIGVQLLLPGISHVGVIQEWGNQGIPQNGNLDGSRTCPRAVTLGTSDSTYDDMKFPPRLIAWNTRAEKFNWSLTVSSREFLYMRE